MDIIELTRKLGHAIQSDERYLAFQVARQNNDEDTVLQEKIGELNLIHANINQALKDENADTAELNEKFRAVYEEVIKNPNMLAYQQTKKEMDDMIGYINQLMSLFVNGEDPDTAEPQALGCGSGCSGCGGGCG